MYKLFKKIFIFAFVFFLFNLTVNAREYDIETRNVFGSSGDDYPANIIKMNDGGYIISGGIGGNTDNYIGKGKSDAFIKRFDKNNNIIWERYFGGNDKDYVDSMFIDSDGYIVFALSYYSNNMIDSDTGANLGLKGYVDIMFYKLDINTGKTKYHKIYSTDGIEDTYCLKQDDEGNYLLAGYGSDSGRSYGYALLLKLDNDFNPIFRQNLGARNGFDGFNDIAIADDGYYMVGSIGSVGTEGLINNTNKGTISVIAKYDKNGNFKWAKKYDKKNYNEFTKIILKDNDLYVSYTTYDNQISPTSYILKYDLNGNLVDETLIGEENRFNINKFKLLEDNTFILFGWTTNLTIPGYNITGTIAPIIYNYDKNLNVKYYIVINEDLTYVKDIYKLDTNKYRFTMATLSKSTNNDIGVFDIIFKEYNITKNITGSGNITVNDKASEDESISLSFTPSEGYELDSYEVLDKNNKKINVTNNMFIMPAGDIKINAKFKKKTYIINTEISVNDLITNDNITIEYGNDKTIKFEPEKGYKISSVFINGIKIEVNNNEIKLNNVNNNVNIKVLYERIIYNANSITYSLNSMRRSFMIINTNQDIEELYINNKLVPKDSYETKIVDDKLELTFKNDYLEKLDVNTYSVEVITEDGGIVTTSIEVLPKEENPKTFDNILTYVFLFGTSAIGILLISKKKIIK